ncbi:MAG TPA: class I SAM-dependent methyltransferase [Candidatus Blautia excrementigallinarum]|nr:class I SAM-dependent methyltransferase [Candidatus Blautia excrementigallinarum]
MELSLRLSAIAELVTEGNRLVDVGCDHGYLPVYLVEKKKIPGAVAADVGKGPLSRAEEHIRQSGLETYIETRLSNGLQEIKKGEGDTLVIAGMGGPLMERILSEGRRTLAGFQELILQPQSDVPHVRRYLFMNGFRITEERVVLEDGKFYFIVKAIPAAGNNSRIPEVPWTEEEFLFGKFLLENRNPILKKYLQRELMIRDRILDRIAGADMPGEKAVTRRNEVEEERRLILAALKRYES